MPPPASSPRLESTELESSCLASPNSSWMTAAIYRQKAEISLAKFNEVTDVLLDQPNLNSTHLFRADIVYDSAGILRTREEKEKALASGTQASPCGTVEGDFESGFLRDIDSGIEGSIESITGFELRRSVVRKLIPRKPQVDDALVQTCLIYDKIYKDDVHRLVVYLPHVNFAHEMPWYHPPTKALAFLYSSYSATGTSISVHFLPFESIKEEIPTRLHRTFLSLLNTLVRLSRPKASSSCENSSPSPFSNIASRDRKEKHKGSYSLAPNAIKDTILPQHVVQDTYTRLKQQYSRDLIDRWVENTEPSKHVFEDLSIAAFLVELWKQMYPLPNTFPGFVDIACGNGVLVYILLKEGYKGEGFDARRRKTWDILDIDEQLTEKLCIPQPFLEALDETAESIILDTIVHTGIFKPSTFIISNHADELTPWTPILAILSSPTQPNPFIAIPCCSHALSGARYRYSSKESQPTAINSSEDQLATGDLRALRASKAKAKNHTDDKSMYGCLTRKVVKIAEDVGCQVELTLMRIPSTRNIGIVGNRRNQNGLKQEIGQTGRTEQLNIEKREETSKQMNGEDVESFTAVSSVKKLIERECAVSGGMKLAARTWIERARSLQSTKGRGKLNLRQHESHT